MNTHISIYLAGSIKKGHEQSHASYWSNNDLESLKRTLSPLDVAFLNPAFRSDDLSDQLSVFGRDMLQVSCSNIVFVDARDQRGLGVGAEMMWAKVHKIPLIILAPKDTHYHKTRTSVLNVPVENWIHPFVESLADVIVESVEEGGKWIKEWAASSSQKIKDLHHVDAAMHYYREKQLDHDVPMKTLLDIDQALKERIGAINIKNQLQQNYLASDSTQILHPRVGVGVVVTRNEKVLLGRRKSPHGHGSWSFPGGHLDFGEDVEACAKRELLEETGLHAFSVSRGPWVNNIMNSSKHYITISMFVNQFEGEPEPLEPEKCDGWFWFDWDALPSPLFEPVSTLIEMMGIEALKK